MNFQSELFLTKDGYHFRTEGIWPHHYRNAVEILLEGSENFDRKAWADTAEKAWEMSCKSILEDYAAMMKARKDLAPIPQDYGMDPGI